MLNGVFEMKDIIIKTTLVIALILAWGLAVLMAPPDPEFDGWNDTEIEAYHQLTNN
jgi:hypothetical protein